MGFNGLTFTGLMFRGLRLGVWGLRRAAAAWGFEKCQVALGGP